MPFDCSSSCSLLFYYFDLKNFAEQMDFCLAVTTLAFDLNNTLGSRQRLILDRITRCKELILSSNSFENICNAISRKGSHQLDEILTSHPNTENDY